MPRIGRNPLKSTPFSSPDVRLTVAVLSCIPEDSGYWSESLPILDICIKSVRKNTQIPFQLIVFDNGSCESVREHLHELHRMGIVDTLFLSNSNVGKVGAWNRLFGSCQTEVTTYTDGDVLFMEGWAEETLRVLDAFPQAGMVTARPWRALDVRELECMTATLSYAERADDVTVRRGDLIAHDILQEHAVSIGRTTFQPIETAPFPDIEFAKGDVTAFAHSGHYQFTIRTKIAQSLLPLVGGSTPIGSHEFDSWDMPLNEKGLLRLSLAKAYVRHLGNRLENESLPADLNVELSRHRSDQLSAQNGDGGGLFTRALQFFLRKLAQRTITRRGLKKLHDQIFHALTSK
jgi:glycosyltransferase involved in cell wall biosynthesis